MPRKALSRASQTAMRVHRNLKPYACCDEHSVILCQCVGQVYTTSVPLDNQSDVCNGSIYGPILWVMCKGPIQCRICCMYRGQILSACSYMYLCTVSSDGSRSSTKDQLYGNSTCIKCSQKEYLYRG